MPAVTVLSMLAVGAQGAAPAGGPPQHATPTAIFATDTGGAHAGKTIPGVAAIVDGHPISMNDVVLLALRNERSYVLDQMIQDYVVERDMKRRGIVVTDAEIDAKIAQLRKSVAPTPLDQVLKMHNVTMAEVRADFFQSIARVKLVANQVKPTAMFHTRAIIVKYCPPELPANVCSVKRDEAQTVNFVKSIQDQLKQGKDFGELAAKYSELTPAGKRGDLGVLFNGIHNIDANVVAAAAKLKPGQIASEPVKLADGYGYCLVQVLSTGGNHPRSENAAYREARDTYVDNQGQYLGPQHVVDMIDHSKIVLVSDAELLSGKPLPKAAATVDGHPIPMKDVIDKCMASDGPRCTDMLVESYVVDRECQRRGITVSDAEIDREVAKLEKAIAPHSIDEALAVHHTTLAQLRLDFKQEIKRQKLVEDQIEPTKMVHCRVIMVKEDQNVGSAPPGGTQKADYDGRKTTDSTLASIQDQLKSGVDFAQLAKQYPPDQPANSDGDVGVLYDGMHDIDTAMLNAGLALNKGEITKDPIKTANGWCLIQAISTSDDHSPDEEALYQDAIQTYKEQEAEMRVPQTIVELVKKSKITYFVHA